MKQLEKMSEGHWRVIENGTGLGVVSLMVAIILLGYLLVGYIDQLISLGI